MPVDRGLAHDLADALVDLYRDVEMRMAAELAQRLAAGIEAPDWAQRKLSAVGQLRRWAQTLLRRLDGRMADEVAQALILAYVRGGNEALNEIARLQSTHPEWLRAAQLDNPGPRFAEMIAARAAGHAAQLAEVRGALPGAEALQRLMFSLVGKIRGAHTRILRWELDSYRTVVARAAAEVLLGLVTRRRAAQVAWEKLLAEGITGFTDKAGRHWELAAYVEMAVRAGVAQAAVEGHLDRLKAAGLDYVIVSNAPGECELCRPWEGKVLSRVGSGARTIQLTHTLRPAELVTVHIAGSVAEAVLAGLMHPNCRHSFSLYLPGVTVAPTDTEDPEGDAARRKLRYLERGVRHWKKREVAAIDPAAGRKAKAKVRVWQARIRDHVADTGLIRQPPRERIGVAR